MAAAGIAWRDVGGGDPRREALMRQSARSRGSSGPAVRRRRASLRGTGSIETDYLNGEIVLLGRLHGVPMPGQRLVRRPEPAAAGRRGKAGCGEPRRGERGAGGGGGGASDGAMAS